jgi:hypothetical protein
VPRTHFSIPIIKCGRLDGDLLVSTQIVESSLIKLFLLLVM